MDKLICNRCECTIEELETGDLVSGSDGSYYVHKDEMVCDSLGYEKTLKEEQAAQDKETISKVALELLKSNSPVVDESRIEDYFKTAKYFVELSKKL